MTYLSTYIDDKPILWYKNNLEFFNKKLKLKFKIMVVLLNYNQYLFFGPNIMS